MVSRDEVIARARQIIQDNVPDQFDPNLPEDAVLNVEGNVDSMGFILVLTKLEGEFDVRIPSNEWDHIRTLGELADAVMANLPEGKE
ncbi:MAG: acyl carrier protein [Atopobiaceae bacterium]|jgi:acyl carrier protein|nr:acyl carrier protein [Atopobiaceae bacterium]